MNTPRSNRQHIGIFGAANSGKSTILNLLTGQEESLVSDLRGTTTDPVYKNMEIPQVGPCVLIDTAGYFDDSPLGQLRQEKTGRVVDECDLFLAVLREETKEPEYLKTLYQTKKPIIGVLNGEIPATLIEDLREKYDMDFVPAKRQDILKAIARTLTAKDSTDLCRDLVKPGDFVLLVMPQDEQAPKGRIILPQVQTLRSLLDNEALSLCVTKEGYLKALEKLPFAPDLIITDSQLFDYVYDHCPKESRLTSFSVLYAAQKGDRDILIQGAEALDEMPEDAKILLLEACTHGAGHEDIGRVQIPRMLREKLLKVQVEHFQGKDFPEDLEGYDLVIMCGSCMLTQTMVRSRMARIMEAGIPVTNYGMAIAKLKGILSKIEL